MLKAIPVFEEVHPGCQALFIFDQSSVHAALAPDALKAFEMNKSNEEHSESKRTHHSGIQPISRILWQNPKDDNGIWGEKGAPADS